MKTLTRLLLLWNTIFLLPALLYFIFWLTVALVAALFSTILLLVILQVFLVVSSIVLAVGLKRRILIEVHASRVPAIKRIYSSASRINFAGYFVLYPINLGLFMNMPLLFGLFVLLAFFVAAPLFLLILWRWFEYGRRSKRMGLGRRYCPDCEVSFGLDTQSRMWFCLKCGKKLCPKCGGFYLHLSRDASLWSCRTCGALFRRRTVPRSTDSLF